METFKLIVLIAFVGVGIFFLGGATYSTASTTVVYRASNVKATTTFPVLERIAKCESGGKQFINGQVAFHANNNGSVDIGKYQINIQHWGKKATKLGYNLATLKGNTAMARYIYLNYGTGAWYLSAKCWR